MIPKQSLLRPKKDRYRLGLLYNSLYKKLENRFDDEICAYCGHKSKHMDHVPPISLIESIDIDEFKSNGGRFILYPACAGCNQRLSDFPDTSYQNRLKRLIKKYSATLSRLPEWTDDEIKELGPSLRASVVQKQVKRINIINKLEAIQFKS